MNKRGNVIIVTMFMTFIIGIMGLIISKYALNLIAISSENYKYYKSYYLAYGGIELELGKIKYHGIGFSDNIKNTDPVVVDNFSGFNYVFSSRIYTTGSILNSKSSSLLGDISDCNLNEYIKLGTGEGFMTPLFYDNSGGYSGKNYVGLQISPSDIEVYYNGDTIASFQSEDLKYSTGMSSIGGSKSLNSILPSEVQNFQSYENPYLVFGAISPSGVCVKADLNFLVSPYSYITSRGSYMDRVVQLNIWKKNSWADFSIYGIY